MKDIRRLLLMLFLFVGAIAPLRAQRIAVSTNAVDLLTLTPNLEVELTLTHKRSLAFSVDANPFQINDNFNFEHLSVGGEYRFWIDQIFYANYLSIAAQFTSRGSSMSEYDDYYNPVGDYFALGLGYGYSFLINMNWNIVPNISVGCGYDLGSVGSSPRFKPMLMNLGVSIQYLIK